MNEFPSTVHERLRVLGALSSRRILLGLSGGQDSTALLLALAEPGCFSGEVLAAHLDHAVREGSAGETGEVRKICRPLGIRLLGGRLDPENVRLLARKRGSLEAALRDLRYRFLLSCAATCGAEWILTGHTRDDQVETVLFRVLRGMDPMSFSGIPEKRPPFLRPLLGVPRSRTLSFCLEMGVEPLADPSNLDGRFARNRIRCRTIPSLRESFHPDLDDLALRLGRAAAGFGIGMGRIIQGRFEDAGHEGEKGLSRSDLVSLPEALREAVLADFLRSGTGFWPAKSLLEEAAGRIRKGREGGPMSLPGGKVLVFRGGRIFVRDGDMEPGSDLPLDPVVLPVPGALRFGSPGVTVSAERDFLGRGCAFPSGNTALVREEGLRRPLWVRRRRPGDRFAPLGAGGSKKLKDFFIDRKIPRSERDRIPVVLDDDGDILWVAGVEVSRKAALRGVEGEKAIRIRLTGNPPSDGN